MKQDRYPWHISLEQNKRTHSSVVESVLVDTLVIDEKQCWHNLVVKEQDSQLVVSLHGRELDVSAFSIRLYLRSRGKMQEFWLCVHYMLCARQDLLLTVKCGLNVFQRNSLAVDWIRTVV